MIAAIEGADTGIMPAIAGAKSQASSLVEQFEIITVFFFCVALMGRQ